MPEPLINSGEAIHESPPEVVVDVQDEHVPKVPIIESIEDFKYGPPKPGGDPWKILWRARMDNEKLRCDAWKDEVQNLLIFVGLFSAVVTAFIVESCKTLRPDPNDAIVNLLSRIATCLDGASNSTVTIISSAAQSFSPTRSSVRVNIFWFISLVLSLITVLVGIIGLQWLREHLSYSAGLSPREKYALCVMRSNGLEAWHVDKIFAFLPLLLQIALILFLGGIIDFLHAIGQGPVVIPVTVVVAVTLIFLVATTILPWLQVTLLFFLSFPKDIPTNNLERSLFLNRNKPPSQCPYKSPQSRAVRYLWLVSLRIYDNIVDPLRHNIVDPLRYRYGFGRHVPRFFASWMDFPLKDDPKSHFIRYTSAASWVMTWQRFDIRWLSIRDGYMRSLLKHSSHEGVEWNYQHTPFYDLVCGLFEDRYHEPHFSSAYHCFSELSELALQPMDPTRKFTSLADLCRQSAFLHELRGSDASTLLPNYLIRQSTSDETTTADFSEIVKTLTIPLHRQILETFIPYGMGTKLLLKLHLLNYFFQTRNVTPLTQIQPGDSTSHCLVLKPINFMAFLDSRESDTEYPVISEETADLTQIILRRTIESSIPSYAVHNPFVQCRILPCFLQSSGVCAARVLGLKSHGESLDTIKDKYHSIFDFIKEQLLQEMESWTPNLCCPSLLFYTSSMFAHSAVAGKYAVKANPPDWVDTDIPFRSMCSTIYTYRHSTIDKGIVDDDIQERLRKGYHHYPVKGFSDEWWDELTKHKFPEEPSHHPSSPPDFPTAQINIGTQS